jgi:hypothetical protein
VRRCRRRVVEWRARKLLMGWETRWRWRRSVGRRWWRIWRRSSGGRERRVVVLLEMLGFVDEEGVWEDCCCFCDFFCRREVFLERRVRAAVVSISGSSSCFVETPLASFGVADLADAVRVFLWMRRTDVMVVISCGCAVTWTGNGFESNSRVFDDIFKYTAADGAYDNESARLGFETLEETLNL